MANLALNNGAFIVTDGALNLTLNTGGSRPRNWEPGRNDAVLGIRDNGDGYAILVATTSRRGEVTYTEFLVSATGAVARRGEELTRADVGDIDGSYTAIGTGASLEGLFDMTLVDVASARGLAGIDLGLAQGRYTITDGIGPVTGTVNLVDSRGNEWEVPAGAEIIGVREKGQGYALLLEQTDRRGNVSYSEVDISATGEVSRRLISLTEAEKAALEPAYAITSTAPAPVMLQLDSPGITDIGTVTYPETGQVQYVIDPDAGGTAANIVLKDSRGNDWSPGRDTIVAVRDLPGTTNGFEILLRDDRGQVTKLAIAEDGTVARSPTVLRDYDLVRESIRFDSDLTGKGFDGDTPDKVAEVINDPETVRADIGKVSVVLSEGGGYFVQAGATPPAAGTAVDRLWDNGNNGTTVPLLLTEDGSGWAPTNAAAGAVPIGARELPNGEFAVLSLRVSDTGRLTYREQNFTATGETDGRDRVVDATALEGFYLQDFNGDGVIDIREASFTTPLTELALNGETILATLAQADALTSATGENGVLRLSGAVAVGQTITLDGIAEDLTVELADVAPGAVIALRQDGSNVVLKGFATIQAAIDDKDTTAGTDIFVGAGTYPNFTVDKDGLSFFASGVVTVNGAGVNQGSAVRIESGVDDLLIDGFTITANGIDLAAVYAVGNNSGLTLTDNTITGAASNAFVSGGSDGAGLTGATFAGNTFVGTSDQALVYVNAQVSVGSTSSNNTFTNNTFTGAANGGLLLGIENSSGTSAVTGNTFNGGASYAAIEVFGDGVTITGNDFTDLDGYPILTPEAASFGENTYLGQTFANFQIGTSGPNTLTSSVNSDLLLGRAGDDTFVFSGPSIGNDVIIEFEGAGVHVGDLIDLKAYTGLEFGDLTIAETAGDSVITSDAFTGSITLLGVTGLIQDDFVFGPLIN